MKTRLGTMLVFLILAGIGISSSFTVQAQGEKVLWHVVASGGAVRVDVGNGMKMSSTIGQPLVGVTTDGTAKHFIGFWGPQFTGTSVDEGNAVTGTGAMFNYPNPFAYQTNINYEVKDAAASVTIRIVDMVGREVRTLLKNESYDAGNHSIQWDAKDDSGADVGAGQYVCEVSVGQNPAVRFPMMLVK